MAVSAVFSAAGGALMLLGGVDTGHPYLIAAGAFVCTALGSVGGIVARVTRQKHLGDGN